MCLPSAWDTMTKEERLRGAAEMRRHHRALVGALSKELDRGVRNGPALRAFDAHHAEHKLAVQRLREARSGEDRIK